MKTYMLKLGIITAMTSDAYHLGKQHGEEKANMEHRHDADRAQFFREVEREAAERDESPKAAP